VQHKLVFTFIYIYRACVVALVLVVLVYLARYLLDCVARSIPFAWLIRFV
jgi:hypothetical protein